MERPVRNQSEQTVKMQPSPLTLFICYQGNQILKVSLKTNNTVADLIEQVRHKIGKRFHQIVGLASLENYWTLDFALQQPNWKLAGIRNHQRLDLILQQVVAEDSGPTLADFHFLACLGEGASAAVFLVRHVGSGQLFALKQIKKENLRQFKTLESVLRQKKILTQIVSKHPYFTQLQASFQSQHHLNLLLQIYPGGQLFYHLTQRKLTEEQAKLCFAEVLLGMEQLHKNKVLYRDLKPENIMVDFDGHMRIGDFGLCRINLEREEMAFSHCGSPQYMAFETRGNDGYGYPADFYTMGAIIYEMVKGFPPYFNGQPLSFQDSSPAFRQLVQAMIRKDPHQRLCSYSQIKKSRWLKNLNWDKIKKYKQIMPTKLNLYTNYIHSEFVEKQFDWQGLRTEGRYDRLFDMFSYMKHHEDGICHYYSLAKSPKVYRNRLIKDQSRTSNSSQKSSKSSTKQSHHSNSKRSDREKSSQKKKNDFFRKKTNKTNIKADIYTTIRPLILDRDRPDVSVKSKSKKRDPSKSKLNKSKDTKDIFMGASSRDPLRTTRSPIKFKTLASVKSAGQLKGFEYIKELDKSSSRRKDCRY